MKIIQEKRNKLEIKASQLIASKIKDYAKSQDKVVLGIPGGRSVSGIFQLLKNQNLPWHKVHIFMIDERLVSIDHPDSNFGLADKEFISFLINKNILPRKNIHPYIYFNMPQKQGTNAYKNELRELSRNYDIILLSSGEDGHIASLFPNHSSIKNPSSFFISVEDAPKLPKRRMTASRKLLERSKTSILLFLGEEKQRAFNNFQNRSMDTTDCPAKLVRKIEDSYVFVDVN